jgi:hypothetical protein
MEIVEQDSEKSQGCWETEKKVWVRNIVRKLLKFNPLIRIERNARRLSIWNVSYQVSVVESESKLKRSRDQIMKEEK